MSGLVRACWIGSQHSQQVALGTHILQRQAQRILGGHSLDVDEEAILPGRFDLGTAFDAGEVDLVLCEGRQTTGQRTLLMIEGEQERCLGRNPRGVRV